MKKQQYIAAVACLVAGAIGIAREYATEKGKERQEAEQNVTQETQQLSPASYEVKPQETTVQETADTNQQMENELETAVDQTADTDSVKE